MQRLKDTGKPFKFKQGLDERILTDEKCEMLFSSKYDGNVTFAFDNVEDYDLIESKLKMIRKYTKRECIFYVLCGYDRDGVYDDDFWDKDVEDTFKRIALLQDYGCLPYIMRYQSDEHKTCHESKFHGVYSSLASWCAQKHIFEKMSYETCSDKRPNTKRYKDEYLEEFPDMKQYCVKTFSRGGGGDEQ